MKLFQRHLTPCLLFLATFQSADAFKGSAINVNNTKTTLQMVQVLFRHGDRNQIYFYPNLSEDKTFEGFGPGQLTNIGKRQEYNLGQFLRTRYDGFISTQYEPSEVSVLVSDMDRTIMSAEMVLAALYQPINLENNWNPLIDWTPIPFRTIPKAEDKILRMTKHCPKYTRLVNEVLRSDYMKQLNKENHELIQYVNTKAGIHANSISGIVDIGDVLVVEESHHHKIPVWGTKVEDALQTLSALLMKAKTSTPELKRLRGGPLLSTLLENMVSSDRGSDKETFLYSAHDSTLMKLMATLDILDPIMPPYSAALIMELHKNPSSSGEQYVEVYYRNDTHREPHRLEIPGCGSPCNLDRLIEITKPVISENWEEECADLSRNKPDHEVYYTPITPLILALGALMLAVVALIFVVGNNLETMRLKKKIHVGYEAI